MAKNQISRGILAKTLDWAYAKALTGFSGVDSAYELGNSYLNEKGTLEQQVNSLIKWQTAKAGLQIADKTYRRVSRLFSEGVVPAQKRDEALAQLSRFNPPPQRFSEIEREFIGEFQKYI